MARLAGALAFMVLFACGGSSEGRGSPSGGRSGGDDTAGGRASGEAGQSTAGSGGCVGERDDERCLAVLAEDFPTDVAVHDGYVYYAVLGGETSPIRRVARDGGAAETLFDGERGSGRLRASDAHLHFGHWPSGSESNAELLRLDLGTGEAEPLATGLSGVDYDTTADRLFWLDRLADSVWAAELDGSNPEALLTLAGLNPVSLDAHGGYLYFHSWAFDTIERLPVTGGELETLVVAGGPGVAGPVLHASGAYWVNYSTGGLYRVPHEGGDAEQLATWDEDEVVEAEFVLLVDDDAVYYARDAEPDVAQSPRVLFRLAQGSSAPEALFEGDVQDVASDEQSLYFADRRRVYRLTPK